MLHYQKLLFVSKIIQIKLISQYHNNLLAKHFSINKNKELIRQKYYWLSFKKDVKTYVKGCDVCFALKTVKHKPYKNLQALPITTY